MSKIPRVTIRDVAKQADCSITTVSLVLNNKKSNVSEKTKERVIKVASELNYRPNQLAVGMVTKKTNVIGLVLPDSSNLFFATLTRVIDKVVSKAGYSLILANTGNDLERDIKALNLFYDRQVDGIIYVKSAEPLDGGEDTTIDFVNKSQIPIVAMCRVATSFNVCSVLIDHQQGGYMATNHLLELGHTRVACMSGYPHATSCEERLKGYKAALKEKNIEFTETLIFNGDFHLGKEKAAIDKFLNAGATAIFSFNDIMGMGLYRELRKRGIEIPRDMSILGYDDIPFSDLIYPAMTTVRQPVNDIGHAAANTLLELINGKEPEQRQKIFKAELILRESIAPPKTIFNSN